MFKLASLRLGLCLCLCVQQILVSKQSVCVCVDQNYLHQGRWVLTSSPAENDSVCVCVCSLYVCSVCCWWQSLISNLYVDCRLKVCEGDVESVCVCVCWLQGACVCACVRMCASADCRVMQIRWSKKSAFWLHQSSLGLSPLSPVSLNFLPLWLTHSLWVSLSPSFFLLLFSVPHHRPFIFLTHALRPSFEFAIEPLNFTHNKVTPDGYRWHFPRFIFSPRAKYQGYTNRGLQFIFRDGGFIRMTFDLHIQFGQNVTTWNSKM